MRIRFKFREGANPGEREDVLDGLPAAAERLFPDEVDPELAELYVTTVADAHGASALRHLQHSEAVEFAEPEPERHLHLPEELGGE
jgi:hypothetical protein